HFSGNGLCLRAFTVALNQACGGGEKVWYASTMHLQLASLDFCRACRAVPTLHVQIRKGTPRGLWAVRTPQARRRYIGTESRALSRVPAVQVYSAIWTIPYFYIREDQPLEFPDTEVRGGFKRQLGRFTNMSRVDSVIWPTSLRKLWFDDLFNHPIDEVMWPASLLSVSFGDDFNLSIAGVTWPPS
ncbi:unnamed protein product, partial [Laminaria digitata]